MRRNDRIQSDTLHCVQRDPTAVGKYQRRELDVSVVQRRKIAAHNRRDALLLRYRLKGGGTPAGTCSGITWFWANTAAAVRLRTLQKWAQKNSIGYPCARS